jgi:hypothetical protein
VAAEIAVRINVGDEFDSGDDKLPVIHLTDVGTWSDGDIECG